MDTEVQWSELQRDPKGVAVLADQGDVHVRRRDGADLVLTREDRVRASAEGSVTAARALRGLLERLPTEAAASALMAEFPWVDVLCAEDQQRFVADFARAFQASAELGQWSVLARAIREWRATAVIHADPALARRLSEPLTDDLGPVPNPGED